MFMLWSGKKCVISEHIISLCVQYAQQYPLHHYRSEEWEQKQWNCLSYLDQGDNNIFVTESESNPQL